MRAGGNGGERYLIAMEWSNARDEWGCLRAICEVWSCRLSSVMAEVAIHVIANAHLRIDVHKVWPLVFIACSASAGLTCVAAVYLLP